MSRIHIAWTDNDTAEGTPPFWLYCITEAGCEEVGPCKIGIATNLDKRMSSLQGGNWRTLNLVWTVRLSNREHAQHAEEYCLSVLRPNVYGPTGRQRLKSEWVEASPTKALKVALMVLDATVGELRRLA